MTNHKDRQMGHQITAPIITLVHGTWARGAEWTQEHSFFRERLRQKLGTPIDFRRFDWSGANSHMERLKAGKMLAEALRDLKPESDASPKPMHFIVAHSHGGNIAHYALQEDQLRASIDGVVCLATPFLEVRPRHLPRQLLWAVGLFLVVTLFAIVGKISYWSGVSSNRALSLYSPLFVLLLVGALPILFAVFPLVKSLLKARGESFSLWKFLKTRPERSELVNSLCLPVLGTKKLFIARPSGDEASGALITSHFFAWILRRIWRYVDLAFSRASWALKVASFFLIASLLMWLLVFMLLQRNIPIFNQWFVLFSILAGMLIELVGCFACFVLGLILFSQYAFGFDAMYLSFELETTAEASPPGEARVFQISIPEPRLSNAKGLAHSRIYENGEVVDAIADWINDHRGSSDP